VSNETNSQTEDERAPHGALRDYWHSIAVQCCLQDAALLMLVPYGTAVLGKLPRPVYREAIGKITELRDIAYHTERKLGYRTQRIEQDLRAAMWNFLKRWNQNPDTPNAPLSTPLENPEC